MPDIYALAWRYLKKRVAKSRRQSISKADLAEWQLEALEQAIDDNTWDKVTSMPRVVISGIPGGEQEKT